MVILFGLWRNLETVFHSGCTDFHSQKQCGRILSSQHHLQHLLFANLLMKAILTGVRWNVIMVLLCVSLINSNIGHLFMCLLAICMSSVEKFLFRFSANFSIFFFYCWVLWAVCVFCKLSCSQLPLTSKQALPLSHALNLPLNHRPDLPLNRRPDWHGVELMRILHFFFSP